MTRQRPEQTSTAGRTAPTCSHSRAPQTTLSDRCRRGRVRVDRETLTHLHVGDLGEFATAELGSGGLPGGRRRGGDPRRAGAARAATESASPQATSRSERLWVGNSATHAIAATTLTDRAQTFRLFGEGSSGFSAYVRFFHLQDLGRSPGIGNIGPQEPTALRRAGWAGSRCSSRGPQSAFAAREGQSLSERPSQGRALC